MKNYFRIHILKKKERKKNMYIFITHKRIFDKIMKTLLQ